MRQFRESRYWISEVGEVWSYWEARKWISPNKYKNNISGKSYHTMRNLPEKWKKIKPVMGTHGYLHLAISIDGIQTSNNIHRLVAEIYTPGYFEGAHVDHIDNNKTNNHYTNLQWCTKAYNQTKRDSLTFPLYSEWSK